MRFNKQIFADTASLLPIISRKNALEVVFTAGSYADAFSVLSAFSVIARGLS